MDVECDNCQDTGMVRYLDEPNNLYTLIEHYCNCWWGKARMDWENSVHLNIDDY